MRELEVLVAGDQSLTDLAAFKAFYGITSSAQDALNTELLAGAQEMVLAYLGRPMRTQTVRETFRIEEQMRSLVLSQWPITSAGLVLERNGVELLLENFLVSPGPGVIYRHEGFLRTPFTVGVWRVTYVSGYASVPSLLKQAVWRQARHAGFTRTQRDGVRSERLEGVRQITFDTGFSQEEAEQGLTPQVLSLLRPFVERYV